MNKFIQISALSILGLFLVLATAFAGGQKESSAPKVATIRLWDIQTQADRQMITAATDRFNAEHPSIKIEPEWFQNNPYKDKIRIALGAGNPPDIFFNWGGGPLRSYVQADDVVDLTPYLAADPGWKARFPDSVWGPATVGGKIYAVPPQGMDAELLFYNKTLFDKYNLPVPATWSELMSDVKTLHENGIIPIALEGKSEWPEMIFVQYLTDRIGGPEAFDGIAKGEKDAWSNPAVIQALERCQELVRAHAFEPGYSAVDFTTQQAPALVAGNKAAMYLQGDWVYGTFLTNYPDFVHQGDLGFAPFPAVGSANAAQVVGSPANYYSVSSKSSYVKQAVEYLKDVNLNAFEVKTMVTKLGRIPPVVGVGPLLTQTKNGAFEVFLYDQISHAPQVQLYWDQYLSPTEAKQMLTNISEVFLLQETPQQFAKNMNATLAQQS